MPICRHDGEATATSNQSTLRGSTGSDHHQYIVWLSRLTLAYLTGLVTVTLEQQSVCRGRNSNRRQDGIRSFKDHEAGTGAAARKAILCGLTSHKVATSRFWSSSLAWISYRCNDKLVSAFLCEEFFLVLDLRRSWLRQRAILFLRSFPCPRSWCCVLCRPDSR
jgi:hypothetical protein